MNRTTLYKEVKLWLTSENFSFETAPSDFAIDLRMRVKNGFVLARFICLEHEVLICATMPIKVPQEKLEPTAALLSRMNAGIRSGSFELIRDNYIIFKLGLRSNSLADLTAGIKSGFGTVLATLDHHLLFLALFICSTEEAVSTFMKVVADQDELTSGPSKTDFGFNSIDSSRGP